MLQTKARIPFKGKLKQTKKCRGNDNSSWNKGLLWKEKISGVHSNSSRGPKTIGDKKRKKGMYNTKKTNYEVASLFFEQPEINRKGQYYYTSNTSVVK